MKSKNRWVVGLHSCMEAIDVNSSDVVTVYQKTGSAIKGQTKLFVDLCDKKKLKIQNKPPAFFDKLCFGHQGVAVELKFSDSTYPQKISNVVMALDSIEDPNNLGGVLRSAWVFGITHVLVPQRGAAHYSVGAAKVASGGAEHVEIVPCQLAHELEFLKKEGYWVYGLAGESTSSISELDLPEKLVWVIGSEDSGLRKPIRSVCDEVVHIPQASPRGCLNASVASAVAMARSFK